jgi:hypothetical protein
MATQYTSILKLALPTQGELSGTWGDVVNDNITSMIEEAIAGRSVINSWAANSHTLTTADGLTSESRAAMLEFTDTGTALSGAATVICPTATKIYVCKNGAGQTVTVKTAAGTGVAIPNGETMFVFCDGTNVVQAVTSLTTLKVGTGVQVSTILDEDNMASDSATALATQQSIKAYVDAQITAQDFDFAGDTGTGAVDLDSQTFTVAGTANEIETSASGQTITIGLPTAIVVTTITTTNVQATNIKANDGTAAITIADSTGQVTVADAVLTTADINGGTADNVTIGGSTAAAGSFTTLGASGTTSLGGALALTGNLDINTNKFNVTAADGNTLIAGTLGVTGNVDLNGGTIDGTVIGGTSPSAITGTTITGTSFVSSGDMTFGDNDKAVFGDGSDLQISHDGTHSKIQDVGTGDLKIQATNLLLEAQDGTNYIYAVDGTAVRLYHPDATNDIKLATTSTGVDVTGTVTADGLSVDGTVDVNLGSDGSPIASLSGASAGRKLDIQSFAVGASVGAGYSINATSGQGELDFQTTGVSRLNIDFGGDISFFEDTGTTEKLTWSASGETLNFADNSKAVFGASDDLQIYHDSTTNDSIITESGAGNLVLQGNSLRLTNTSGVRYLQGNSGAEVNLWHNGNKKLETTATGIDVTGTVTADDVLVGTGTTTKAALGTAVTQIDIANAVGFGPELFIHNSGQGGEAKSVLTFGGKLSGYEGYTASLHTTNNDGLFIGTKDASDGVADQYTLPTTRMNIASNGDISFYEDTGTTAKLTWSASGETLNFADNAKAVFGAGSDLQIYHDGSNSYIVDAGTGDLYFRSASNLYIGNAAGTQSYITAADGGAVDLRYNGSAKLATTSTGIDVTGTITADGLATLSANLKLPSNGTLFTTGDTGLNHYTNNYLYMAGGSNGIIFKGQGLTPEFAKYEAGGITFNEDGGDMDFRVESNSNANMLFVEAGTDRVGIGTNDPQEMLYMRSSGADARLGIDAPTGYDAEIKFSNNQNVEYTIGHDDGNDLFVIGTTNVDTPAVTVNKSGFAGFGGNTSPLVNIHSKSTSSGEQLRLESTDSGGSYGPLMGLYRNSSTPADSDGLGQINFYGEDSASNITTYASISGIIQDVSNGTEDGRLVILTQGAGSERNRLDVRADSLNINEDGQDTDFRVESDSNANMLLVDASGNQVGVGKNPSNTFDVEGSASFGNTSTNNTIVLNGKQDGTVIKFNAGGSHRFDLDCNGTGTDNLSFNDTDSTKIFTIYRSNDVVVNEDATSTVDFRVESVGVSDMFFVDASGNRVIIGRNIGSATLEIYEAANKTEADAHFRITGSGYSGNHWLDGAAYYIGQNSTSRSLRFYSGAETAGAQLSNGSTSFTTFSDERLKYDVEPIENALDSLSGLRTVKYRLEGVDSPEDKKKLGVIAQDLVGVHDEVLDSMTRSGDDTEYMGVRYTELVPVLIKAMQEQTEIINDLRARVTQLESN